MTTRAGTKQRHNVLGTSLRIAILGSRGYPSTYGGFETFVRRLAPWLVSRGHEVTVYGRSEGRRRVSEIDGIRVVDTVGLSTKSASTVTHGLTAALSCASERPDVVLALNVANGLGLPLLKARGVPVVMNVDGLEWQRAKWGRLASAGFRLGAHASARIADVLVADSREIARIWTEEFGVDPVFIPYGADVIENVGQSRVTALGLTPGSYALVVARLAPENNVELFVDAMAQLDWSIPSVVVGSANYDNPLEGRLRALASAGRLTWLGHVADQDLLSELWANAGVYFHGHSVGGTNPALLQALGHGAPTIAVDTVYNREVLARDDQLVRADASAVANAVRELLDDQPHRVELAAAGRNTITDRYLWESVLSDYEATFASSLERDARS